MCVLQSLGGLAYQSLYQRILSAASSAQAQVTCFAAAGTVFIMGIPSVVIGAVAASAGTHDCKHLAVHIWHTHKIQVRKHTPAVGPATVVKGMG